MKLRVLILPTFFILGCDVLRDEIDDYEANVFEKFRFAGPAANPSNAYADDPRAADLGRKIFFDPAFSGPVLPESAGVPEALGQVGEVGKVACASCHDPAEGGTDHRSPGGISLGTGFTGRNAPSVLNAAYSELWQFWDGRKDSLWSQALGPMESPVEHNGSRLRFAHIIYDEYREEYEALFGPLPNALADTSRFPSDGKPGDPAFDQLSAGDQELIGRIYSNIGKSLEAYQRLLLCKDSAFDRWLDGDEEAMSPSAKRGARLFIGEAGCIECHRGGNFTDYRFHNIGVPQYGAYVPRVDVGRSHGIEMLKSDIFNRAGVYSDDPSDQHLIALEPSSLTEGQFKTPTLRCVSQTAPYMHNGVYETLWEVLEHYRFGGNTGGNLTGTKDVVLRPLVLDDKDLEHLVEFLLSLDGEPLPEELMRGDR